MNFNHCTSGWLILILEEQSCYHKGYKTLTLYPWTQMCSEIGWDYSQRLSLYWK